MERCKLYLLQGEYFIMEQNLILLPIGLMILLTFIVALHLRYFAARGAIDEEIRLGYFKDNQVDTPDYLLTVRHHYKNMFEVPILFYIICILIYVTNNIDIIELILAWIFVGIKYIHSAIRMTTNYVPYRAKAFSVGFFVIIVQYCYFFIKII